MNHQEIRKRFLAVVDEEASRGGRGTIARAEAVAGLRRGWLYVNTWYMIGPWESYGRNDFSITHPPEQGIDLALSWFYTDSVTDRPLLDLVGHPVVVNPDPMLYRDAIRRQWPVRLFDPPRPAESQPDDAVGADA